MEILVECNGFRLLRRIYGGYEIHYYDKSFNCWSLVYIVYILPVAYKLFNGLASGKISLKVNDYFKGC